MHYPIHAAGRPDWLAPPHEDRRDRDRFEWGSLLLLLPALALLIALFLIPAAYAGYLGLTDLRLIGPTAVHWHFTGTANVERLVTDPGFAESTWLTVIFVAGSVVGVVAIGLALALLLERASPVARILVGGLVVVIYMLPAITAGITWYASTTASGTVAALFGMPKADFLHSEPLIIVTVANVWSQTGFAMLVLMAALRNIPNEIVEAAILENASGWQRFRRVILPLLMPTILTTILLVVLISLANFSLIYVMTQGGPGEATNILPIYSYRQAFVFGNLAYGALLGNAMVLLAALFGLIYARAASRGQR
jgi:multiple sugar transport system permease protein